MARVMLSTQDNPYNPFTQYDLWSSYDERICGYYSASLLARFAPVSPLETRAEAERVTEDAVDTIIDMNLPLFNPNTGKPTKHIKFYSGKN